MLSKKVLSILLCSAIILSTATLTTISAAAEEIDYSQSDAYTEEVFDNATSQWVINVSLNDINSRGFHSAVQAALDTARDRATDNTNYRIVVPAGSYTTKHSLKIYSNTYLYLQGVTITRSSDSVSNIIRTGTTDSATSGVTGYLNYRNITIDGGTLNGNGTRNTIVKLAHGTNIAVINTAMHNVNNGHMMEVAGIDGLTIRNCSFSDQRMDSALIGYEAIQIDVLVQSHFVGYRSEDIPMKDILIEGCSFKNCPRGIGSHTGVLNSPFDGVKIRNCTFENMGSVAIQGQNWINCEITGNIIDNAPRGIAIYSTMDKGKGTYTSSVLAVEGNTTSHVSNAYIPVDNHNITISNNTITRCGYIKDVYASYSSGGITVVGYDLKTVHPKNSDGSGGLPIGNYYVKGVTIQNNTIDTKGHGIRLVDTKSATVTDNTVNCLPNPFDTANYHGIFVYEGEADTIKNNSVYNASVNGIYVYKQANVTNISDNLVLNANNYGISIDKSKASSINYNTVNDSRSNGIHITNGSTILNEISNNSINYAGYHGVNVIGASNGGTIFHNTIINPARNVVNVSGDSTAAVGTNYTSAVSSVSLDKASLTLEAGASYTLTRTISPSNASTYCTWSSSNPSVASVDSNGNVTAIEEGTATITVTSHNGKTASCSVTVERDTTIALNKTNIVLGAGETYTLTKTVTPANTVCTFSSSNPSVATVDVNGKIITKQTGTATITVSTPKGKTASCVVTVKNAPNSIVLNKTTIMLGVGESFDLNSTLPKNTASYRIEYSSDNTEIASVSTTDGIVTAKNAGTAIITATTYNGKKVTCKVNVKNAPDSISLNKTSVTLGVGESLYLNSSLPSGTASYNIKYSSDNTDVASVMLTGGMVTANKAGTATITATTHNGKTATCIVTVKNAPEKIALNIPTITLGVGETFRLSSRIPNGTASYSMKYSSDSTDVASVTASGGIITAKKAGTATMTLTTHNGKTATCVVTVKKPPKKIALNKTILELGVGEVFNLDALMSSEYASYNIKFSSNNTSVASVVSANGIITAKATGTATITATAHNGTKVSCTVVVRNAPDSISLNKTNITLGAGETFDLNNVLPSDTASYSVKYSSNRSSVASVSIYSGIVTTKKPGTAIITARTHNGKTATCTVTVKEAPGSISLNETNITLGVGETFKLNHTLPADTASYSVRYTSSSSKVAGVALLSGRVTAKNPGTAVITAKTYNGKTAICRVTVQ